MGNAKATKRTKKMFIGKYTLIFAKDGYLIDLGKNKHGKTHKRLVELTVVGWQYQIKENKLLHIGKLWKMIT